MSKSVEELFRDAPAGATHYVEGITNAVWRNHEGIDALYWHNGKWSLVGMRSAKCEDVLGDKLIARTTQSPQPKPWSGPQDGLPPVNERVEVLWSSITGQYVEGIILAHDEDRAVFRFVTGDRKGEYQADKPHFSSGKLWPNFRPIKTPEQILAEKRETAIRELMDIAQVDCRVTAARLVDAGFKREGV